MIGSLPEPPAGERQLVSLDEKLTSRVTLFRRANGGGIAQLVERLVRNEYRLNALTFAHALWSDLS
jgi:hypothetical protein